MAGPAKKKKTTFTMGDNRFQAQAADQNISPFEDGSLIKEAVSAPAEKHSPVDLLPESIKRSSPRSRTRDYSQEPPAATFRLIPTAVHDRLREIKQLEGISVGEIARRFFEFGVQSHAEKKLDLTPFLADGAWSLYPESHSGKVKRSELHRTPSKAGLRKPRTFHGIPDALKLKLDRIAYDLNVPIGELARKFLESGIAAYSSGELVFEKELVARIHTLYPEDYQRG
jgi:hypothetical protein